MALVRCLVSEGHGTDGFLVPRSSIIDAKGRYQSVTCPYCCCKNRVISLASAFGRVYMNEDRNGVSFLLTDILATIAERDGFFPN